jgi:hypothetical protein
MSLRGAGASTRGPCHGRPDRAEPTGETDRPDPEVVAMRRLLVVVGSVLLTLALTAPIVVATDNVTGITVQSATVNKAGLVIVRGTMYCQNGIQWVDAQGAVTQAMGHKATITGGFYGGSFECLNGPTSFEVAAYANTGIFAPGWANVQISFGWNTCNEFGCFWEWWGGNDFYVKLTKA